MEVLRRHVHPGSKRALECLVSVFHAPREIPVRLEDSGFTRGAMVDGLVILKLKDE